MFPAEATLAPLDAMAVAGLREHVHRALRQALLSGSFAPGARLNERAIAEQLGVSTTPVKEALRLLEADGLVRTKPRSGVIVNFDFAWAEEMILARAAIESTIARLAAQRIAPEDKPVLAQILTDMAQATAESSADDLVRLNEAFHGHIRSVARANYLRLLNDRQDVYDSGARRVIHSDPAERQRGLEEHTAIGRAVIAQDADSAEAAMKAHVLRAGESYLDLVFRKNKD
ncbi:GntR family transcriptional regulator [Paracoccus aestuariivivens]|uniref:GntR family transcriptional regulator n=1 Tax=Paracoccus aestuariivivens TaxID=1820333 RepID=A0A6L6JBQ4_9RHOB|nr:GntR family transcriptional regulator [Paracoccus aestuariivivens]MTH78057.1 GntR family transcriptional regulator [Paracoccus aestuariivivens]